MSAPFPFPWLYPYSPGIAYEIEPPGIIAGSSLVFCKLLPCFPAPNWQLNYGLVPKRGQATGPVLFSSSPLNGGNIHFVNVLPAVTGLWTPQTYQYQVFAAVTSQGATALGIDPSTNFPVGGGEIVVFPNLTVQGSVDSRGKWERILDEIDAMILSIAGDTQEEISIGRGTIAGQTLKGWDRERLVTFRDYALHMAGNEQRIRDVRGGRPNPRYKYAVMTGGGAGFARNGFPDIVPFA